MVELQEVISFVAEVDPLLADKLRVEGGCLVYGGYRNKDGYGKLTRAGTVRFAHRHLWEAIHGDIPEGMRILHRCDNPPCCNPAHLFLGTQQENIQDMMQKGRGHWPGQKGRPGLVGARNHKSKLTAATVKWIREHYSPKYGSPFGSARLAKRFGVSRNTILAAAQGKTWRVA